MKSSNPILFTAEKLQAFELQSEDVPELQNFFEANPQYFFVCEDRPPAANEARKEFLSLPPEGWDFTKRWFLRFVDENGVMIGMASLVSDLLAPRVWHIGLFIVATARHGKGDAALLYQAMQTWAVQNGAQWFRLGVIEGNTSAERFWLKMGFVQTRKRPPIEMGTRLNTVIVMAKPLNGGTIETYLDLIPRDRPEA